jgi:MFS family permease
MIGPTIGGWLYERVGPSVPYLLVGALSIVAALGFVWLRTSHDRREVDSVPLGRVMRVPAVAVCSTAVVLGGGTLAMLEPVLSLFLAEQIGLGPARVGIVFGAAALVSASLHPICGRLADRTGGRRLMLTGLVGLGLLLPLLPRIWSFESAIVLNGIFTIAVAAMITPSLAYMADAVSTAGVRSFGVAYGIYNFAWAIGLLAGPALGGAGYEQAGFARLALWWSVVLLLFTALLARAGRPAAAQNAVLKYGPGGKS